MSEPLELKTVNELLGEHFFIPHYQRGYRWTQHQVRDLLNDIWGFATKSKDKIKDGEFYCLQPIVVKRKNWVEEENVIDGYEVIDGQQRLTTLYIIIMYLAKEFLKVETLTDDYDGKEIFTLKYETRPGSERFLKNITEDKTYIDYYHIYSAYNTVKEWFTNSAYTKDRTDKNRFLDTLLGKKEDERSVQVIWYNVEPKYDNDELELKKSIELFIRLNVGKIPLTNAELIKGLFLSSSSFENENNDDSIRMKMEISQIWDEIEQKLSDEDFWSFVTNKKKESYATKIELLFDLMSVKTKEQIDPLYTFLYFLKKSKNQKSLWDLWRSIEFYYLTLCEWYKNKNLYHKIGYLITVGEDPRELIDLSAEKQKNQFEDFLDEKICTSVEYDIESLSYDKPFDYWKIEKILLLFNVESIRKNKSITQFYPFKFHKSINWSIEHIHAQNSESMDKTKKDSWFKWLNYHEKLIHELIEDKTDKSSTNEWNNILAEIEKFNNEKLTWEKFSQLAEIIIKRFSEQTDLESNGLHSISNLALLSQPDNAALNNSVFEVKRREIIRMDKEGNYIPLCTRRVFLKYYNDKPSTQQYYFWGKEDKINYLKEIKTVLIEYLQEETNSN